MRKLGLALGALLVCAAQPADAFSTRVHMTIANDVRKTLIASGNNTIPLKGGSYVVELPPEDAQAIIDNPLEFRAGAVGPDNIAFPGMTDPSHAIGQRPFEQCQALYEEAILPAEKAYALGCFLHGSTDAVAHHWVNYLSGETFTLNPITSGRAQSFDNVVRHIVAESMIQSSAFSLQPERFTAGELTHTIPQGFLLRAYFDEQSPLFAIMAARAKAEFDASKTANPGASLVTIITGANLAPADHLVLAPIYLREVDTERVKLKASIQQTIADLQNPNNPDGAELGVTAGSDGQLGTTDDDTACTASCPSLFSQYKIYVALLAPRFDASNNPLPSAFDKLSDELSADLFQFLPAYAQTIENVSGKFNEPLVAGQSSFNIEKSDIPILFSPLITWSNDLTTIDYLTLTQTLLPDWLIDLQNLMQSVGVNVDLAQILEALLDPFISPIKDAIKQYAIDQVQEILGQLVDELKAKEAGVEAEYQTRIQNAAPAGLTGNMLDHFYESGLYSHAFNIAAVAIAKHEAVLPVGNEDPYGIGPATFDASHVVSWMQAAVCPYLKDAVFPLGIDAAASFSVLGDGNQKLMATLSDDSPIECHDGSLTAFTPAPSVTTCELVSLETLTTESAHRGSVSRAFPPLYGDPAVQCTGLDVPGLPDPPPGFGGTGGGSGGSVNAGKPSSSGDSGGCGCRVGSSSESGSALLLFAALALMAALRRRRRLVIAAAPVMLLSLTACGSDSGGGGGSPGGTGGSGTGGTSTGGTGGTNTGGTGGMGTGGDGGSGAGAQVLIDALGKSVWNGMQTRNGKTRAIEIRFDAPSLFWAEIQNPFGPGRKRTMRAMNIEADGATVHTTVLTPPGWPVPPDNGKKEDFTVTVIDGSPRSLEVVTANGTETYEEGAWPAPLEGLTAEIRVFPPGGSVAGAFCEANTFTGPDRTELWAFARGTNAEPATGTDVMAGAHLDAWVDNSGQNQFATTDVPGFSDLGGTELSDQFDFMVRYTGTLSHPGGSFSMREFDDDVRDAIWAFVGPDVGSSNENDLFLEVHGHAPADYTPDAPSATFAQQDLPIEVIILRCDQTLQDIDIEANTGTGFLLVGDHPTKPAINDELFPPAL